jgi:hypothetical protein
VQDSQDNLLAEMRLLQHDEIATKQFLSNQLENMDDAIDSLRHEFARSKDQQALTALSIQARAVEMDEKMFTLDKELLKFKLMLPSSISAQMPPKFCDGVQTSEAAMAIISMDGNRSSVAVTQKLGELAANLEAMYAGCGVCTILQYSCGLLTGVLFNQEARAGRVPQCRPPTV